MVGDNQYHKCCECNRSMQQCRKAVGLLHAKYRWVCRQCWAKFAYAAFMPDQSTISEQTEAKFLLGGYIED